MPFISDDELDDLNKKIDSLEESRESLDQLNDNYREDLKQKATKIRGFTAACIILSIGLIASVLFGFVFTNSKKPQSTESQKPIIVRDTIYIEKELTDNNYYQEDTASSYYGVQLGVYREYDVDFTSEIQKIYDGDLIYYVFGKFNTYQEADDFRLIIKDLKVKDAVVVKVENGYIVD